LKVCIKCGASKPLTDYHKNCGNKDGLQGKCKPCVSAWGKTYIKKKKPPLGVEQIEHLRATKKCPKCGGAPGDLEKRLRVADYRCRCCLRKDHQDSYQRRKDFRPKQKRKKKVRDPSIERTRGLLNRAALAGRIVRGPCQVCGDPKSQGHHEDYDKPLDVIWLCAKHHAMVHRIDRNEVHEVVDKIKAARPALEVRDG